MTRKHLGDTHLSGLNCWHYFMGDHAVVSMVIPLAADKTLVRVKWLVHKDAVEGVDYDRENLTEVWVATTAENAELVGRSHAGIVDPTYRPVPYSRFTEPQLENIATWYAEQSRAHGY